MRRNKRCHWLRRPRNPHYTHEVSVPRWEKGSQKAAISPQSNMVSISRISMKCGCANTTMQQNGSRFVRLGDLGISSLRVRATLSFCGSIFLRSCPENKNMRRYAAASPCLLCLLCLLCRIICLLLGIRTYVLIRMLIVPTYVRSAVYIAQPAASPIAVRTAVPIVVPTLCCAHKCAQ